jgi:hypothetical protein
MNLLNKSEMSGNLLGAAMYYENIFGQLVSLLPDLNSAFRNPHSAIGRYSHSIVLGGLDEIS